MGTGWQIIRSSILLAGCGWILGGCVKDKDDPEVDEGHSFFLEDDRITISDIADLPDPMTFSRVEAEIQGEWWEVVRTVEGKYDDGLIVLPLPAGFTSAELMKAVRDNVSDYTGFWQARSDNADARVAGLGDIIAYNDAGRRVGRIYLTDWSGTGAAEFKSFACYLYADRAFAVSGSNQSYRFSAAFEPGWNAYAIVKAAEGDNPGPSTVTTTVSETTPLAWHFESWVY